jgi:hypothetical protein
MRFMRTTCTPIRNMTAGEVDTVCATS